MEMPEEVSATRNEGAPGQVPDPKISRMRIYPSDVEKHGPTYKCLGCRAVALKKRSQAHSEDSRKRMTKVIAETPEGAERVQFAEEKFNEELARRLQRDAVKIDEEEDERERKKARRDEA